MEEKKTEKVLESSDNSDLNQKEDNKLQEEELKKSNNFLGRVNAIINKEIEEESVKKDPNEEESKDSFHKKSIQDLMDEGDELESDEDQDKPPIQIPLSKEEDYTLKNILVPKYSFNELTQPQLTKIYE